MPGAVAVGIAAQGGDEIQREGDEEHGEDGARRGAARGRGRREGEEAEVLPPFLPPKGYSNMLPVWALMSHQMRWSGWAGERRLSNIVINGPGGCIGRRRCAR